MTEAKADRHVWSAVTESAKTVTRSVGFELVYAQHFAFVWRSALALGVHRNDIDDVVQDVFLVVHKKLDAFENRSSLRTWVAGIMLNITREYRRSHRYARGATELSEDIPSLDPTPDALAAQCAATRIFSQIFEWLSEEQRIVFALSELEEMTAPDIATALNINVNTVYSRLRLARREVDRQLSRLRMAEQRATS